MFYVVHSIPNYSNPQTVLSAHSTLQLAKQAALVAAQACCAEYADKDITVEDYAAEMLDANCVATFGVADDCFNITTDLNAYCSNMLRD